MWFITGSSRGLGREWTMAALERGDLVAATARHTSSLEELTTRFGASVLVLPLDVTDRSAAFAAVDRTEETFGRIDIIVNNAGYGQFGMAEELTEEEIRLQMETNLLGIVWVTQAALPLLRRQGRGHLIQVSSIAGLKGVANLSIYCASKWAVEGYSEALAQEVADLGIQVTIVEPGGYRTDWNGTSAKHATPHAAYDHLRSHLRQGGSSRGLPGATRAPILQLVDDPNPPLRVLFGDGLLNIVQSEYDYRLSLWRDWEELSIAAHGVEPNTRTPEVGDG